MALYGNTGMGAFGTPGYGSRDFPLEMIQQYPGTQNFEQGGQMFGNLLYGPYSNAYNITSAQTADPFAETFQGETAAAGGFPGTGAGPGAIGAQPGAGTRAFANLQGGMFGANAAGQKAQGQQQNQALQGMQQTATDYTNAVYGTQNAALNLATAQAEQQAKEQQGIMSLINMFTSPTGMGANILGPGGLGVYNTPGSPLGAAVGGISNWMTPALSTGGLDITDFSSMLGSFGAAGGAAEGTSEGLDALMALGAA